jgi:hypothetical protein
MVEVIKKMMVKVENEIVTFEEIKESYGGDARTYDLMIMMSKRQLQDLHQMLDLASGIEDGIL